MLFSKLSQTIIRQHKAKSLIYFAELCLIGHLGCAPASAVSIGTTAKAAETSSYKFVGLALSPFVDGQDPNQGASVSKSQLKQRMKRVRGYCEWIRTYGCSNGLERAGSIAHRYGLKAAIGAWLGRDLQANEVELATAIDKANAGEADMLIVGSEVLLRNDLSEDQLLDYINRAKRQAPGIPVTSGEVYGVLLSHPRLISAVDVVLAHYWPYWQGVDVASAVAALHNWHSQVVAAANGKEVIVGETGHPSCGNRLGDSVPSPENASFYALNFVSWARATGTRYFYFSAYDEEWKAHYEGEVGRCWGIMDSQGNLKPGMQDVLDGKELPDNWTPRNPSIEFTVVPRYGSFDDVRGLARNVSPARYKVAVYIRVSGGWWTKPYADSPLTTIQSNGAWICDITTGGSDQDATDIVAYLIPDSYAPPLVLGNSTLPAELEGNSVAKVEVTRTP